MSKLAVPFRHYLGEFTYPYQGLLGTQVSFLPLYPVLPHTLYEAKLASQLSTMNVSRERLTLWQTL